MKSLRFTLFSLLLGFSIFYSYYYELKKSRHFQIKYTPSEHPYIETSFNGFLENFRIDLGGSFFIKIDPLISDKIDYKKFEHDTTIIDINRNKKVFQEYGLDNVKFMDIKFDKIFFLPNPRSLIKTNTLDCDTETVFSKSIKIEKDTLSLMGHRILIDLNFCFDFSSQFFSIYKPGLIPLFHFPYGFFSFSKKIPFEYDYNNGIICKFMTDFGEKRFLIDTCAPVSLLKIQDDSNPKISLNKLILGDKNLGPIKVFGVKVLPSDSYEGVIGMDVLFNKALFFNLSENYLCFR